MPPKKTFEKKEIIKVALKILQEKGILELSARKIAHKLKTSVAPIYTYFESIDSLKRQVLIEVKNMVLDYAKKQYTKAAPLNCGVGFVIFARDNPKLFRILFLENAEYKDIITDLTNTLREVMHVAPKIKELKNSEKENISMNLWILAYGMATLACIGVLEDNSEEFIISKLREIAKTEILAALDSKNSNGK